MSRPPRRRSARPPAARRRTGDPARTAAYEVLRQVDASDAYANLTLPPLLRSRGIRGRDAAFATELTYGTLRMRGRYDAIIGLAADRDIAKVDPPVRDVLRLGIHQLQAMRVPPHAAVSETVGLARAVLGAGPAQFVNAVLRSVTRTSPEEWLTRVADAQPPGDDVARLAAVESHPPWVVRAIREALVGTGRSAAETAEALRADNVAPEVTLVARPGLVTPEDLASALGDRARPGRWSPWAVRMSSGDPGHVAAVRRGHAGIQDEGSQLVALALAAAPVTATAAPPGPERWLDLCAGPGGKAALLGALAARRGAHLVANEVQPHRADLVRQAVSALPAVEVRTGDGRTIGAEEPLTYTRVLVDAPCTGLGALRRRPEARWRRTPADVGPLTTLQRELLGAALDATAPGGVVAYVTCSPHLAETTLVVQDVLRGRDDVEVLDARDAVRAVLRPGADMDLGSSRSVQLWPHVHGTDAMHLTLVRRTAPDGRSSRR